MHYFVHCEALVARDAARVFPKFQMLDCFAKKVMSGWDVVQIDATS
jgi:hypothetical protein